MSVALSVPSASDPSFDLQAFLDALLALYPNARDATATLPTGASSSLDVSLIMPSSAAATAAATSMGAQTPAGLSGALGVSVSTIATPIVAHEVVHPSPPPPPPPPSPPPPSPSPSPPTPLAGVGAAYLPTVTSEIAFPPGYDPQSMLDLTALVGRLRAMFGGATSITPDLHQLTTPPYTQLLRLAMMYPDGSDASEASALLGSVSTAELSTALGVPIASVGAPTVSIEAYATPSPPPSPPPKEAKGTMTLNLVPNAKIQVALKPTDRAKLVEVQKLMGAAEGHAGAAQAMTLRPEDKAALEIEIVGPPRVLGVLEKLRIPNKSYAISSTLPVATRHPLYTARGHAPSPIHCPWPCAIPPFTALSFVPRVRYVSPPRAITLTTDEKAKAGIPRNAILFGFAYPIEHDAAADYEQKLFQKATTVRPASTRSPPLYPPSPDISRLLPPSPPLYPPHLDRPRVVASRENCYRTRGSSSPSLAVSSTLITMETCSR